MHARAARWLSDWPHVFARPVLASIGGFVCSNDSIGAPRITPVRCGAPWSATERAAPARPSFHSHHLLLSKSTPIPSRHRVAKYQRPPINGGVARQSALARNYFRPTLTGLQPMQKKDFSRAILSPRRAAPSAARAAAFPIQVSTPWAILAAKQL